MHKSIFFHIKKKQKFNATKNSYDELMDWNGYRTTSYYRAHFLVKKVI